MSEWLGSGLQPRVCEFESHPALKIKIKGNWNERKILVITNESWWRGGGEEIKTLYHNKTRAEMVSMMNVIQDMNEHLILSLVRISPKSTYEDIIRIGNSEMYFMDSKRNWNNSKTEEEIEDDIIEEQVMESLLNGDMGVA